ncbi:lipoprotein insertase outer membrane protein LolB [Dokdonella sp.]|jgi:outer membrane lipoprotein LolB|uniref:lipoprotein insertase outer membrane protein LolB n=1 Tax=Dokdonella sp. TaxID=2291710 RepID=UPI0037837E2A
MKNLLVFALAVLLAACSAPRTRPDAQGSGDQERREQQLAAQPEWSLQGRIAVSAPGDSGSGSLHWQQQGDHYRISVNAPVSGKTWTLAGDQAGASLSGLHGQPRHASDAATLLQRELGWKVPVADLAWWVRGLRAPGTSEMSFREDGLPAEIRQHGWVVEFRDYLADHDPLMPRRIFASNGRYTVRLIVQQWRFP